MNKKWMILVFAALLSSNVAIAQQMNEENAEVMDDAVMDDAGMDDAAMDEAVSTDSAMANEAMIPEDIMNEELINEVTGEENAAN